MVEPYIVEQQVDLGHHGQQVKEVPILMTLINLIMMEQVKL